VPFRRRSAASRPPRRRIRRLRLLLLFAVLVVLSATSFTLGLVTAIAREIPSLEPENWTEQRNGYIYANDGKTVLAVLRGSENRVFVEWDDISSRMKQAIVAVEDRRFWDHRGVDLRGILRALWADIRQQKVVEGGSTIVQQFVKNAYLDDRQSIGRKVREAALAWQLHQKWSKQKILTAYLNTVYFGNGAYGVQQAARVYFDKIAEDLKLHEAALLAGIPADPSSYDPVARPRAARARRTKVLGDMLELGWITAREYTRAARTPLPRPRDVRLPGTQTPWAPYFTNYVKQQLIDSERYGPRKVFGGGLRVRTTIDLGLHELGRQAIAKWLPHAQGPAAALVAIDPKTGDVLAMIGGRNFRDSQFNLAAQSERQPGSAFKPFVLAAALQAGIAPSTTFVSRRVSIPLGDKFWLVENYEDSYLGAIDLGTATIHSDNAVYAELTRLVGPARVARTARNLGVRSPLRAYFAIGLGAQAVNPLELARAYAVFANGGYRLDTRSFGNRPRVIQQITAPGGKVDRNVQTSHQVLTSRTVGIVNDLLQKVIQQGTGRRAALAGWPAAGKTGTTENHGDAWFVGYTPELVTAVWVGYPTQLRPMLTEFHGDPVAGGTYPAQIWKTFMEAALPYLGKEPVGFPEPALDYAVTTRVVHRGGRTQLDNGLCRDAREVAYFAGFGPRTRADCKVNEVEVPRVVGQPLSAARARLALQPLTSEVIYTWARPRQRVDVVLSQFPAQGTLSSFDTVKLVLGRARHGLVPKVEGASLRHARRKLRLRKLTPKVARFVQGARGKVVSQSPPAGVAAAPGMTVSLVVGRPARALQRD
jgi:penicillin-binding protein 1A